ncbi:MAG TPA: nucleotide excision repair protein, partial [Candidatus Tectomicrobia bacterium]|nr:nucleotide excision repair protein [Candidatus Tectomicrobia bacterium]
MEIPTSPKHRAAWILYQLSIHGSSFAEVAKHLGVTRQAVRNTAFFLHSPRIEQAIAKVIGRKP